MPKLYSGPNQDFYRVWEREDKSLLIEVLHDNKTWRKRLLGSKPPVTTLPDDVLTPKKNNIRAAVLLFDVIHDFPEAFREGRVEFTAQIPETQNSTQILEPAEEVRARPSTVTVPQDQARLKILGSGSAGALDPLVGRAFFYQQIYHLKPALPDALTTNPGLYAVLQEGELLGELIGGLPPDTLRCTKIGMSDVGVRERIFCQYFGKNQRAAIPRRLVGDALIGRAMKAHKEFAGFGLTSLNDVRALWNEGTSPSEAICGKNAVAQRFNLVTSRDLTDFELPLELAVTTYMNDFRFIAFSAKPEDVTKIEDAANSLLRDVADVDPSSCTWIGKYSSRDAVRKYGLWATVGVTRKYRPYATHECDLKGTDDQGRPVADWLLRLRDLIDKELSAGR
ncbi:MAG: hypothetical protein ACREQW_10225 [Candidatus Binatia bacterium]